ncbi:MAG: HD domain-containing protein [Lactobacillales bacterium]|jgi:hypothetical protein|nr:HD domain-containing protein [Lactobacillales bacterium]
MTSGYSLAAKLDRFKKHIIEKSNEPRFIHAPWFVKWHLEIVEQLCHELCDLYPEANRDLVLLLVWLHDYGKILAGQPKEFPKGDELTLTEGKKKLLELEFPPDFVEKAIKYVKQVDEAISRDLSDAPIEVQIISSADGASHLVGPFMSLYWYENHDKTWPELMESNVKKALKDWNHKITLPEVKKRFQDRHDYLMENTGQFQKFIK